MQKPIVTVVGASGALGGDIVKALKDRGAEVRALVRPTSDRVRLQAMGVTQFLVADLNDPDALRQALFAQPPADAVISSAAGFTAHSARTKVDNSRTDIEGYQNLINATKAADIPRFILISILECDRAPGVPHFSQKLHAERYLAETGQPYLSLRAGAFLNRARDVVPDSLKKGVFPDILPGTPMALVYSKDLARYAAMAAIDLPVSAMNQTVDIGSDVPATGEMVAAAFTRVLKRPIIAKPVFPPLLFAAARLVAPLLPRLRDQLAVLRWLRKGGYVSRHPSKQKLLFGELPTVDQIVARYVRDKGLA